MVFGRGSLKQTLRRSLGQDGPQPSEGDATFREHWKRAQSNDADAQYWVAKQYAGGHSGVTKNGKEAIEWYQKAADQGHGCALFRLGECYEYGRLVEEDYAKAVKYYQLALDHQTSCAASRLPIVQKKLKEQTKGKTKLESLEKRANDGDVAAQYDLGLYYASASPPNYREATTWWDKAAKQGHGPSQYEMGKCYADGKRGVPQCWEKAVQQYFTPAAAQGNAGAQLYLGLCYARAQGVPRQDWEKAVEWLELSAELGEDDARHYLGPAKRELAKLVK